MKATLVRRALRGGRRHGVSLVELVATFLILAFVTVGTLNLYNVGNRQQRNARFYSQAQTDIREGIRRILRTVRHGSAVLTGTSFSAADSTTSQIIVAVPQASPGDQIRIYASSGNIYAQTAGDAAASLAGTLMVAAPATLLVNYSQTTVTATGTTITAVDGAPASATEAQVTITATRGSVTTKSIAYVELRNRSLGF